MLKKPLIGLLVALLIIPIFNLSVASAADSTENRSEETSQDWKLVWNDEFDEEEINMNNWSFDRPDNGRWNGEIQSYTDQNAWVENGNLIIEAREEKFTEPDGQTYDYTSSKLITKGKQIWTYGKVEVKAKMPTGQGMWPAIWMMPEDEPFYGTWPVSGEIDIMELLGHEPDTVYGTIHYGEPKREHQGEYTLPAGESFADDYHLYSVEWEPGEIRWYIDGNLYHTANDWFSKHPDYADEYTYPAPFDQDFFLILNISVGGDWPGNPDQTTELPQQMAVDYVRVYQKDEYPMKEKPEQSEQEKQGREPQEDGNYIYNGEFNVNDPEVDGIEGVANTSYWTFLQAAGGEAEVAIVEGGHVHVKMENGGNAEHGVQLLQTPITLEKGAKYKASFKAKAENERSMKVKIGGDGDRGWDDYAAKSPITLSTDWENYEFEFIMSQDTDIKARYEFNMGLDNGDVWLGDVRLEKVEDAPIIDPSEVVRPALPTGNYIYNGGFDQGTDRMGFWEFKKDNSADAVAYIGNAVNERRFETRINSGGDHAQSIQLVQERLNLEQGKSYQLKFDANADTSRTMQVSLVSESGHVIANHTVDLEPEIKEYSIDFDVDEITGNNVELQFNLGGSDVNVSIDNVFLGKVMRSDGIEGNLIRNGLFDGLTNWITESISPGEAEFEEDEDGHFKASVKNVGSENWHIQLFQNGINLEKDASYELSFKAKSTIDRPIGILLEHNGEQDGNYISYFGEKPLLTDTFQTYSYTFKMEHDTDPATKFGFTLGSDGNPDVPTSEHDIYIDDVVLKKIDETEPGTEEPGTEEPGTEEPGTEEPGTEEPGTEEPGTEEPGTEEPGTEEPGTEEPGTEEPGTEEPGTEEPGTEEPGTEKPGEEKSISDEKEAGSNQLPNTATTMFSGLTIGFALLLMGLVLILYLRRKSLMVKKK